MTLRRSRSARRSRKAHRSLAPCVPARSWPLSGARAGRPSPCRNPRSKGRCSNSAGSAFMLSRPRRLPPERSQNSSNSASFNPARRPWSCSRALASKRHGASANSSPSRAFDFAQMVDAPVRPAYKRARARLGLKPGLFIYLTGAEGAAGNESRWPTPNRPRRRRARPFAAPR